MSEYIHMYNDFISLSTILNVRCCLYYAWFYFVNYASLLCSKQDWKKKQQINVFLCLTISLLCQSFHPSLIYKIRNSLYKYAFSVHSSAFAPPYTHFIHRWCTCTWLNLSCENALIFTNRLDRIQTSSACNNRFLVQTGTRTEHIRIAHSNTRFFCRTTLHKRPELHKKNNNYITSWTGISIFINVENFSIEETGIQKL